MNSTQISDGLRFFEADAGFLTDMPEWTARDLPNPNRSHNIRNANRSISHQKILHEARSLARRLAGLGPRYKARAALIVDRHLEFVSFFMACRYAGLVPLRLRPSTTSHDSATEAAHLHNGLVNCRAEIAIASDANLALLMKAASGLNLSFYGSTGAIIHLPEVE